jgi:hypothetical protein
MCRSLSGYLNEKVPSMTRSRMNAALTALILVITALLTMPSMAKVNRATFPSGSRSSFFPRA